MYFKSSMSVQDVKDVINSHFKEQDIILKNDSSDINTIISLVSKFNFDSKSKVLELLNKDRDNSLGREEKFFTKSVLTFFALMDYICRSDNVNQIMRPEMVSEPFGFEGPFSEEIENFQNVLDIPIFCFIRNESSDKPLLFNSFKNDMKKIKKYFLMDFEEDQFDEILSKYFKYSRNIKK